MIFWSIKVTILSLILIFVFHNLYGFFKHTLTTPKIKDLVNKPQKKYDEIKSSLLIRSVPASQTGAHRHVLQTIEKLCLS